MEQIKFYQLLKDLEMMFSKLDDWQREQYFKYLGRYPEFIIKKAIEYLIANHNHRSVPLIGEIQEAVDEIEKANSSVAIDELEVSDCNLCASTGIVLFEKSYANEKRTYSTAKPCSCSRGRIYEKSFRKKWKKQASPIEEEIPF
jgi:hypothetical protein